MEDTFLDGIFLGMRLRSDEILIGKLSRRAHCDDELKKNNGTLNSPSPSKGNLDNLFLGSTATTFLQQFRTEQECAWKKIRRVLVWDNRMKVLIHRKHEKFRCHQTDAEENVRHERFGNEVRSNTWLSRMCHDWQSSPSQSLGHMQGQDARRTGEE